ncbi:T9SS type A sorting domain-containing protein [candidate division KSB1 bacterium]|nr:T9SS type A sorting domain-containing protein [candidate division KSB1 bacterium]
MRHLIFIILVFGFFNSAFAAIDRQYDPVVISGEALSALFGAPVDELVVQKYDASGDSWQSIPFQIDERDMNGNYFGTFDGVLDANDELLVMARDLGDRATNDAWPDDAQAQGRFRVELTVTDTGTDQKGYAYLLWSTVLGKSPVSYLSYQPGYVDQVIGETYYLGHDPDQASGLPTSLFVPRALGGDPDSVDLLKYQRVRLQVRGNISGFSLTVDLKEKMNQSILGLVDIVVKQKAAPDVLQGPIRIIRNNTLDISLKGDLQGTTIDEQIDFPLRMYYLPNYYEFSGEGKAIPEIEPTSNAEARLARAEFSQVMSSSGFGMIYYNPVNADEGIRVNDVIHSNSGGYTIDQSGWPGKHWYALVSDPAWPTGTPNYNGLATIFSLTELNGSPIGDAQAITFTEYDNDDVERLYADAGLRLLANDNNTIAGVLDVILRHYVIPETMTYPELQGFFDTYKTKFQITPLASTLDVVQPAQVLDLAVEQVNDNSMTLSWTAVGDDGSSNGPASSYQMRYSTQPLTEANKLQWWAAATPVQSLPAPADPGTLQNVTITGLDIEQQYFFVLQVGDDVGNLSELSQVASGSTTPVELQSFVLAAEKDQVFIDFSTASESQNWGFEIQRRIADDQNWQTVAFLKGHGTTSETQTYSYVDKPGQFGTLEYRLKQIDLDGRSMMFDAVSVTLTAPREFMLAQNYPNPFNPTTQIAFEIPENVSGEMSLIVYDMLGRRVRTLVEQPAQAGFYQIVWNGRDSNNRLVSSGIYFYVLRTQNETLTRKMIKLQ